MLQLTYDQYPYENPYADVCVIDGGDLLYQTSWSQHKSYEDVCNGYEQYIERNFASKIVWVIFDGDDHYDSTKNEVHNRRDAG